MDHQKFSFNKRLQSFRFAYRGFLFLFRNEHNALIHLVISFIVIVAGFFFRINLIEWIFVSLAIGLVFASELINTAIEQIANAITLQQDERIKNAKDLAAGSVLLLSIVAIIIGLIIFAPKIASLFIRS